MTVQEAIDAVLKQLATAYPSQRREDLRDKLDAIVLAARQAGTTDADIGAQLESWCTQFPRRRGRWLSAEAGLRDLEDLLLDPQSRRGRAVRKMRLWAGSVVEHYVVWGSVIVVIGGTFYGLAYARFYEALNTTPEQAGFSSTQILAHSVIGGVVMVLLAALAVTAIVISAIPIRPMPTVSDGVRSWGGVVANAALTGLGIGALLLLGDAVGRFDLGLVCAGMSLAIFLFISLDYESIGSGLIRPEPMSFVLDDYLIVLFVGILIGLPVTGVATLIKAKSLGEEASAGKAVRDPQILGFPFLGVRAEPALVSWRTPTRVQGLPRCVLYLGSANGKEILYDHHSHGTFHVPGDEVALELRSQMSSCDAPENRRVPTLVEHDNGIVQCRRGHWRYRIEPSFEYSWILKGHPLAVTGDETENWLDPEGLDPDDALYCKVTAETPLGRDSAVSPPIVLAESPPAQFGQQSAAAP
jgi:hypothetical protein